MADKNSPSREAGIVEKFIDQGDGTHALAMALVDAGGDITLAGDVIVDTLGALDNAKVTDPDAASATVPALLRGMLAEMKAQTTLLTTIASNTAPA